MEQHIGCHVITGMEKDELKAGEYGGWRGWLISALLGVPKHPVRGRYVYLQKIPLFEDAVRCPVRKGGLCRGRWPCEPEPDIRVINSDDFERGMKTYGLK